MPTRTETVFSVLTFETYAGISHASDSEFPAVFLPLGWFDPPLFTFTDRPIVTMSKHPNL